MGKTKNSLKWEDGLVIEFGKRLRHARERAGFTQSSLARRMKITRQTVNRLECQGDIPSFWVACKFAQELNVAPFYLACIWDDPQPLMTAEEMKLLKAFRAMTPKNRKILVESVTAMADVNKMTAKVLDSLKT